jgi:CDP-diacylglycerol--glycerol-3-phosphate 3-phosphatidyltransferase
MIKQVANAISLGRILGAVILLLTEPLSVMFFIFYAICCVSDVLDGYIARKTKTTSRLGERLDSIADLVLAAVLLCIFIPLLTLELWMLWWIGIIAFIRILSLVIGGIKYRTLSSLHTYANQVTGAALVCFPILFHFTGLAITMRILCGIATLSAFEELVITFQSKVLDRNRASIFITGER